MGGKYENGVRCTWTVEPHAGPLVLWLNELEPRELQRRLDVETGVCPSCIAVCMCSCVRMFMRLLVC